jgi:hypothetical protein
LLALACCDATHQGTHQGNELRDAHNVDAKGRGTQLAHLRLPALLLQLQALLLDLLPGLPFKLLAQLEQPLLLDSQRPLASS